MGPTASSPRWLAAEKRLKVSKSPSLESQVAGQEEGGQEHQDHQQHPGEGGDGGESGHVMDAHLQKGLVQLRLNILPTGLRRKNTPNKNLEQKRQ